MAIPSGLSLEVVGEGQIANRHYVKFYGSGTYTAADFAITRRIQYEDPNDTTSDQNTFGGLGFKPKSVRVLNLTDLAETNALRGEDDTDFKTYGLKQALNRAFHINVPLDSFKETSNFDVGAIAANGGVLASDTTPVRDAINAATDGCQRLLWASSNNDQITAQVVLPPDIDVAEDLTVHFRIASGGTTNAVGFTLGSYFNEDDTAVADTSGTNQTTTVTEVTATIAAADIPAGAKTLTFGLTPVAHTADTLQLTACWITGLRLAGYSPRVPTYAAHGLALRSDGGITVDASVAGPITDNDDFIIECVG